MGIGQIEAGGGGAGGAELRVVLPAESSIAFVPEESAEEEFVLRLGERQAARQGERGGAIVTQGRRRGCRHLVLRSRSRGARRRESLLFGRGHPRLSRAFGVPVCGCPCGLWGVTHDRPAQLTPHPLCG